MEESGQWSRQISASCWSSDGLCYVPWVNVIEWFELAADEEILALQRSGYGWFDSSVTARLLEFFEKKDAGVADLFAYSDEDDEYAISIICHIDWRESQAWLEHERPHLVGAIGEAGGTGALTPDMIEAVLSADRFQEWLNRQPQGSAVGFTVAITGDEAYPADKTVIAQYLHACFPGEVMWAKGEVVGYWAKGKGPRSFALDARRFGWVGSFLACLDGEATARGTLGFQVVTREQALACFIANTGSHTP